MDVRRGGEYPQHPVPDLPQGCPQLPPPLLQGSLPHGDGGGNQDCDLQRGQGPKDQGQGPQGDKEGQGEKEGLGKGGGEAGQAQGGEGPGEGEGGQQEAEGQGGQGLQDEAPGALKELKLIQTLNPHHKTTGLELPKILTIHYVPYEVGNFIFDNTQNEF